MDVRKRLKAKKDENVGKEQERMGGHALSYLSLEPRIRNSRRIMIRYQQPISPVVLL
jgi:hypothetical protein